jgi:hypothetical protein
MKAVFLLYNDKKVPSPSPSPSHAMLGVVVCVDLCGGGAVVKFMKVLDLFKGELW